MAASHPKKLDALIEVDLGAFCPQPAATSIPAPAATSVLENVSIPLGPSI
jgi:hypothetical protein